MEIVFQNKPANVVFSNGYDIAIKKDIIVGFQLVPIAGRKGDALIPDHEPEWRVVCIYKGNGGVQSIVMFVSNDEAKAIQRYKEYVLELNSKEYNAD